MAGRKPKTLRCAPYCRVSVSERMENGFSSLTAQLESVKAYIASQKEEGWECVPEQYCDDGFSGANLERPAMKRLLRDIEEGRIGCVVVQRIDRLSRSLSDFLKLMEKFDHHGVSFVSTAQRFDTSTSTGKLMLHILMSFSEFERQLISERTACKMAASKRKGRWCGGMLPLGFDLRDGHLVPNKREAKQVRQVFQIFLETESLSETLRAIQKQGIRQKKWKIEAGSLRGGNLFTKNAIRSLLSNVVYVGRVKLKDQTFDGQHDGIVDEAVFRKAQLLLTRNGAAGGPRRTSNALLRGLLHCSNCKCLMTPTHSQKDQRRYRYYTCSSAQKNGWRTCPSPSLPAAEIEKFVIDQIRCIGQDPALRKEVLRQIRTQANQQRRELEKEKRALQRQHARLSAALGKLVGQEAKTDRMEATLANVRAVEARVKEIGGELEGLNKGEVDEGKVATLLEQFDEVWAALTPKEQGDVLRLLIDRVDYDGREGKIAITFHNSGLTAFSEKLDGEAA